MPTPPLSLLFGIILLIVGVAAWIGAITGAGPIINDPKNDALGPRDSWTRHGAIALLGTLAIIAALFFLSAAFRTTR